MFNTITFGARPAVIHYVENDLVAKLTGGFIRRVSHIEAKRKGISLAPWQVYMGVACLGMAYFAFKVECERQNTYRRYQSYQNSFKNQYREEFRNHSSKNYNSRGYYRSYSRADYRSRNDSSSSYRSNFGAGSSYAPRQESSQSDHYTTLGLLPTATGKEIRKAYLGLAMLHHPDRSGSINGEDAKFKSILTAYQRLAAIKPH